MDNGLVNFNYVINSVVFSLIGLVVFGAGFYFFDKVTPYHLWREIIEKQNLALSVVVGATTIAFALIISSAIHG